jgi:hypothetical protein
MMSAGPPLGSVKPPGALAEGTAKKIGAVRSPEHQTMKSRIEVRNICLFGDQRDDVACPAILTELALPRLRPGEGRIECGDLGELERWRGLGDDQHASPVGPARRDCDSLSVPRIGRTKSRPKGNQVSGRQFGAWILLPPDIPQAWR